MKTQMMLSAACVLAVTGSASAAAVLTDVIYVDADSTNTGALASINNAAGVWQDAGTPARNTNDLWDERAFGFNDTILTSGDQGGEDSAELTTTISGLTAGQAYEIIGVYSGHPSANWEIFMGLTSGSLTRYDNTSPNTITETDTAFTTSESMGGAGGNSGIPMRWAVIGTTTADSSGEIAVFIDDTGAGQNNERSWYDGVGYREVPEPGSLALLGLGGLALLRRRRA